MSLRAYLLDRLPRKSQRQIKIVQLNLSKSNIQGTSTLEAEVEQLLEHVLVGCLDLPQHETDELDTQCLSQALSSFNSSLSFEKGKNMEWLDVSKYPLPFLLFAIVGHVVGGRKTCSLRCDWAAPELKHPID